MFRWTDERVQHLVRFVRALVERGVSAKQAWECYARLYGTTPTSAMTLYYRGHRRFGDLPALEWDALPEDARALASAPSRRAGGRKAAAPALRTPPAPSSHHPVQEAFTALEMLGSIGKDYPAIGMDVLPVLASLARLAAKAAVGLQAQEVLAEAQALRDRVARLERQVEALHQVQVAWQQERQRTQAALMDKLQELDAHLQRVRRVHEALGDLIDKTAPTQATDSPLRGTEFRRRLQVEAERLDGALQALDDWKKVVMARVNGPPGKERLDVS